MSDLNLKVEGGVYGPDGDWVGTTQLTVDVETTNSIQMFMYKFRQKYPGNPDFRTGKPTPIREEQLEFFNPSGKKLDIDIRKTLGENGVANSQFFVRFWNGQLYEDAKSGKGQRKFPFGTKFNPQTGEALPKFDPETGSQNW